MGRRYKKLSITLDLLIQMHKANEIRVKLMNPLPEDARVVDVETNCHDTSTGFSYILHVIMESKEFEELADGAEIPVYDITFERLPEPQYPKITYCDCNDVDPIYLDYIPDSSPYERIRKEKKCQH